MTARQGHPLFQSQTSSSQHLRERQKFFEDVLQHEVDLYYPQIHRLNSERWRPPLDSVSSMEVNIDSLELSEPLDITEMEPSDAFQQYEDPLSPLTPADLQGIDYFKLRFPFSAPPGQQHPHDAQDGDSTARQEEAADVLPKEHTAEAAHNDPHKTSLSETQ